MVETDPVAYLVDERIAFVIPGKVAALKRFPVDHDAIIQRVALVPEREGRESEDPARVVEEVQGVDVQVRSASNTEGSLHPGYIADRVPVVVSNALDAGDLEPERHVR